jgi:hypothetical protein
MLALRNRMIMSSSSTGPRLVDQFLSHQGVGRPALQAVQPPLSHLTATSIKTSVGSRIELEILMNARSPLHCSLGASNGGSRQPSSPQDEAVGRLVEQIKAILAGQPPEIQGAALADLLALWLAGHAYEGMPSASARLREALLLKHTAQVLARVPSTARMHGTDQQAPA